MRRARTVLGVVLVVGAVAQLAVLRVARAQQAALGCQPHRELRTARDAADALHQRLHRRQQQLCAQRMPSPFVDPCPGVIEGRY